MKKFSNFFSLARNVFKRLCKNTQKPPMKPSLSLKQKAALKQFNGPLGMKKRHRTDFIVVHCSATSASMDIGAEEIRRWHRERNFIDIGYHYVIRRDGSIESGRDLYVPGAHVSGFNSRSVGICLVGGSSGNGRSENNFTPAQFAALEKIIKDLAKIWPDAIVQGHRDFPNVVKDCPSFDVREWWNDVCE